MPLSISTSIAASPSQDSETAVGLSRSFPSSPSLVMDFPSMHDDGKVKEVAPLRLDLGNESGNNKRRLENGPITLLPKRSKQYYDSPPTFLPKTVPKGYFEDMCTTCYTGEVCEEISPMVEKEEESSFPLCLTPRRRQDNDSLPLSPPLLSSPHFEGEIINFDEACQEQGKLLIPLLLWRHFLPWFKKQHMFYIIGPSLYCKIHTA